MLPSEPVEWPIQAAVDIELARRLAPAEAAEQCAAIARRSEAHSAWSAWMNARLAQTDALRRVDAAAAARQAERLASDLVQIVPTDAYLPEFGWVCFEALRNAGQQAAAQAALAGARDWIEHEALPNVADEFRDSFLRRNRVNQAIVAALATARLTPLGQS